MILPKRSAEAAATTLAAALDKQWDRAGIRRILEQRDWRQTAQQVAQVLNKAIENPEVS